MYHYVPLTTRLESSVPFNILVRSGIDLTLRIASHNQCIENIVI